MCDRVIVSSFLDEIFQAYDCELEKTAYASAQSCNTKSSAKNENVYVINKVVRTPLNAAKQV